MAAFGKSQTSCKSMVRGSKFELWYVAFGRWRLLPWSTSSPFFCWRMVTGPLREPIANILCFVGYPCVFLASTNRELRADSGG